MDSSTSKRRPIIITALITLACALAFGFSPAARAADGADILLGVFFSADRDYTDTLYASYDGAHFYMLGTPYEHAFYDLRGGLHYGHSNPSIMYKDGYFWMISSWNRNDGRFWPMISYSKDLKTWTYPEGNSLLSGTKGVSLDKLPSIDGTTYSNFDAIAPEWFVDSDGTAYIIFSAGYYGGLHGNPTRDKMQAYILRVDELSASDGTPDGSTGYAWPNNLVFRCGEAKRLSFTETSGANFIDGAVYKEGGSYYLFIKKSGLTMQVYKTGDINNASSWQLVNGNALYSFEGMSVGRLNSTYFGYVDHVVGATADGVQLTTSGSLDRTSAWPAPGFVSFAGGRSVRHGSVIELRAGTPEWSAAKALLDRQGVSVTEPQAPPADDGGSAAAPAPEVEGAWKQSGGKWWYRHGDGSYTADGWEYIGGKWYLFDSNGWMRTGWVSRGGSWYLLNSSGAMVTGWKKVDGSWYYLNDPKGDMATGWKKVDGSWYWLNAPEGDMASGWKQVGDDWYYLNSDGTMATGWKKIDDIWYFFKDSGAMARGWAKDGESWYLFRDNGVMLSGDWYKVGEEWYYLNSDGTMATGWKKIDGTWYYLKKDGSMALGWTKIGDSWYFFDSPDGNMLSSDWYKIGDGWYFLNEDGSAAVGWKKIGGEWYFFDEEAKMALGWTKVDGLWYYFEAPEGNMLYGGWHSIDGSWYYLEETGAMATGWKKIDGSWYYFSESGKMATGWKQIGDSWYYFAPASGVMYANRWHGDYYLGEDGAMLTDAQTPDGYYVGEDGRYIGTAE